MRSKKNSFKTIFDHSFTLAQCSNCYKGEFNGKWIFKKNISKKALFDGVWTNLKPLFNSNMIKVPIVKWSRKSIFVAGSVFSGIPMFLGNCLFQCKFKIIGQAKKIGFRPQKSNSKTTLKQILLPYYYYKVVSDLPEVHQKVLFLEIYFLKINFSINLLLQLFEHYTKVKDRSKMVSKVIFSDLMPFLMDINNRQHKFQI